MTAATFFSHVPVWVWGLLLALVAYGVSQASPRRLGLRRSIVMPLAMTGLSLSGVLSAFGTAVVPLAAWAAALLATVAVLHGRVDVSAVRYDAAAAQYALPGSWLPLALMMALFALKFAIGAGLALHPSLHGSMPFATLTSCAGGACSGIFLARAVAWWRLAWRTVSPIPA